MQRKRNVTEIQPVREALPGAVISKLVANTEYIGVCSALHIAQSFATAGTVVKAPEEFRRRILAEGDIDFRPQIKQDIGIAVVLDFLLTLTARLRIRDQAETGGKAWRDEKPLPKPDLLVTCDRAGPDFAGEAFAKPGGYANLAAQFYIADTVGIKLVAAADSGVSFIFHWNERSTFQHVFFRHGASETEYRLARLRSHILRGER
ncbi:hypothetical protein AGR3A_Lc160209 [Agrobacterium tomkonis CFBP 6623]|uniref:Uncharacterized protein n=1 Tax=Agrobacterium tomkonis CFBP 6623 TaxID=1183432 RepID=A0A1S7S097_9HYPH|nr:hypothetical protein AGR3A_Lc160209 [Agrobacterium tomkonis CFBP 6623]